MSFKASMSFFLIPLFILVGSGCENVPSPEGRGVEQSMQIWVNPDYRGDSVYVEVPVSRRGL
ncbi:MAG: hypothetical protein ACJAUP_001762 [Cellvibrionaceae bacterium]|jgi:hypothetical protein